ncbi:MAG: hypothetical protein E6J91_42645 [Deltaproteobacteria bacterium]|nr:MAG: hypothetical protein E6J91_42645 [Deltaproteobacteria bacterium]
MKVGFGHNGSVMNDAGQIGFRSLEAGGEAYEHFAVGDPEEGYAIFYKVGAADLVAHDVYAGAPGDLVNITPVSHSVLRNDANELVKETLSRTNDGMLEIRNMLTFAADATRVTVRMDITNISKRGDLTEVLVKRYCDIDVDTGGPNGWAIFQNHFSKDRDSVHAWNQPSEIKAPGKHAHIVNMVAMPSDVPLDQTFIGMMGFDQFKTRANSSPITDSALHDGIGILQWEATRLRVGESIRLNMYYDAFCVCTDLPLVFKHDPTSVRATDIAIAGHHAAPSKQPAPTKT